MPRWWHRQSAFVAKALDILRVGGNDFISDLAHGKLQLGVWVNPKDNGFLAVLDRRRGTHSTVPIRTRVRALCRCRGLRCAKIGAPQAGQILIMKAARIPRFGGPEVFSLDEIPTPVPAAGEALVRIKACGVNRMDTELRAGVYGGVPLREFFFGKSIVLPHLPGVEPAGIVESVEDKATTLEAGMRVIPHSHLSCGECEQCRAGYDNACAQIRVLGVQTPGQGGYAEFFSWPASHLLPFSDKLSFSDAAALLVNYGPVWFGLTERAGLKRNDTVLVTGAAGGCGHAALDIARHVGAHAIALTRSPDKVAALRAAGAGHVVIDRGDQQWPDEVSALTDGRGADCVVELVGAATWDGSIKSAASRGRIVVIGSHSGLRVALNLGEVFGKNLSIEGITRANRSAMEQVLRHAEDGRLHPTISHILPLAEVAEAHRLMDTDGHTGKIVLTMD